MLPVTELPNSVLQLTKISLRSAFAAEHCYVGRTPDEALTMDWEPKEITAILDACCNAFSFPMLDNGYVYLAAARLSAYRSETDWALVIETFGFSPREGFPSITIQTFASTLRDRDPPEGYVTRAAHEAYLSRNPHNEFRTVHPLDENEWQDPDDGELVAQNATKLSLRGNSVELPSPATYLALGIDLGEFPQVRVFELCRALAALHRDDILATAARTPR